MTYIVAPSTAKSRGGSQNTAKSNTLLVATTTKTRNGIFNRAATSLQGENQTLNVSVKKDNYRETVPQLHSALSDRVKWFKAGCIADHQKQWEKITSDLEVLNTVSGMSIEFQDTTHTPVGPNNLSKEENSLVQKEIDKLSVKGIIKKSEHEEG